MSARIGRNQFVLTLKLVAPGIDPVVVASGSAMQQQQPRTLAAYFVVQGDAV